MGRGGRFAARMTGFGWLVLALALASGCATTSLFTPYPFQAAEIKAKLSQGKFDQAIASLDKFRHSKDKTLYMLEQGRVAQVAGRYPKSMEAFDIAIAEEAQADLKAKISLSKMAASGSSLLTNDNAIPYRAAAYERILMYNYQALNYLALGKLEGAGVEVRRAALEQRDALERHHKELARLDEQAREQRRLVARNQDQVAARFRQMREAVAGLKNAFQSAYTFYISGVIYELLGEPNDAYIDYKKAYEIYPDNPYLQADLLRLSAQLGFDEDHERFSRLFSPPRGAQEGRELILLYEEGFVPPKQQVFIDFYTPHGIQAVAFPFYSDVSSPPRPLSLSTGEDEPLGRTALITDVQALAVKDLAEKLPAITLRQVLRLVAKYQLQKQAEDNLGSLGAAAAMIYNVMSESADLRSWLTLPSKVHVLRVHLPVGMKQVKLNVPGYHLARMVTLDETRPGPAILHVVALQGRMVVRQLW